MDRRGLDSRKSPEGQVLACDFCHKAMTLADPHKNYRARPMQAMAMDANNPEPLLTMNFSTIWLTCLDCAAVVDRKDRRELVYRASRELVKDVPREFQVVIIAALKKMVQEFFDNLLESGVPDPVGGFDGADHFGKFSRDPGR